MTDNRAAIDGSHDSTRRLAVSHIAPLASAKLTSARGRPTTNSNEPPIVEPTDSTSAATSAHRAAAGMASGRKVTLDEGHAKGILGGVSNLTLTSVGGARPLPGRQLGCDHLMSRAPNGRSWNESLQRVLAREGACSHSVGKVVERIVGGLLTRIVAEPRIRKRALPRAA